MRRQVLASLCFGLVFASLNGAQAASWCDQRFQFTCGPIEGSPAAALQEQADSVAQAAKPLAVANRKPASKPKAKEETKPKKSRLAVKTEPQGVRQQASATLGAMAVAVLAADEPAVTAKAAAVTLVADAAPIQPIQPLLEAVLGLELSIQSVPSLVQTAALRRSACVVEQGFNDLFASSERRADKKIAGRAEHTAASENGSESPRAALTGGLVVSAQLANVMPAR
jgi:hypothetical protein